jgi:hypothetical protein
VQFHPVEARQVGPHGGIGKQAGQSLRQPGNMRQVGVGHTFALAHRQRFELARVQHRFKLVIVQPDQPGANCVIAFACKANSGAMLIGDLKKAGEEHVALRPPPDRQEVDQLDEQSCGPRNFPGAPGLPTCEGRRYSGHARYAAAVRRYVSHAGCLDHDGGGLAAGEPAIPVEHIAGHFTFFGRPPRHHGRHPGAVAKREPAMMQGLEQP